MIHVMFGSPLPWQTVRCVPIEFNTKPPSHVGVFCVFFSGLGFNIVGGVDQHYVANDSGIYVSKIKEDGPAALDGRLQEGDKILTVINDFHQTTTFIKFFNNPIIL